MEQIVSILNPLDTWQLQQQAQSVVNAAPQNVVNVGNNGQPGRVGTALSWLRGKCITAWAQKMCPPYPAKPKWHIFPQFFIALALLALVGCAFNPSVIDHSFSFDARWDSPDVDVLNYRYGNSKIAAARTQDYELREGRIRNSASISGEMLRGDFLYVKWRIKSSGEVFEDTVDLRERLPADINKHRIYFIIKGPQLYVFLISPDRLEQNPCPSRDELRRLGNSDSPFDKVFSMYCYRKITTLYPDQPKP